MKDSTVERLTANLKTLKGEQEQIKRERSALTIQNKAINNQIEEIEELLKDRIQIDLFDK